MGKQIMKVGIVGLGRMGAAMAQRLREQGFEVVGWDQRDETNKTLAAGGLRIAANARDVAAASEIVISSITEDNGARCIFNGADGFLHGDVNGKLFVEMSTLQPMTGRELAPLVEAKGARLIEAPVLGTIPQVRAGTLFAMVGGAAEDLARARPVLEKMTRRILHMGPHGAGYAMKLAANVGLGAYVQAIAESLALGAKQGLALDHMLDALSESATATGWLKAKTGMLKGEPGDMSLDIRTLRKDIMSAVATGALTGVPMPLSAGTLASLSAAVAGDYGAGDIAELPKFFREAMLQNF
jgi:3-hydroxyisobutyrate dehydrogenase